MTRADFVIDDADVVVTCAGPAPRRGAAQGDVSSIRRASVASSGGRIVFVGPADSLTNAVTIEPGAVRMHARGCTVIPGFVDPHTHLVFAGDRRDELRRRLGGATYAEIAAAGGGILRTVAATRAASEQDLIAAGRARPHHALPDTGWLTVPIRTQADLEDAIRIFRMNYERAWTVKRSTA